MCHYTDSSTGHEVLDEVSQMRHLNPDELAGPYRHLARSSTTHHVPPYGMLKQMREKDIEEECRMMSTRQRRPTPGPGGKIERKMIIIMSEMNQTN